MKKILLIATILIIAMASVASARPTLKWSAVENTETCKIAGYIVHYSTDGVNWEKRNVGDVLEKDLSVYGVKVGDQFKVSAVSETKDEGPASDPVEYDGRSIPLKVITIRITVEEE